MDEFRKFAPPSGGLSRLRVRLDAEDARRFELRFAAAAAALALVLAGGALTQRWSERREMERLAFAAPATQSPVLRMDGVTIY